MPSTYISLHLFTRYREEILLPYKSFRNEFNPVFNPNETFVWVCTVKWKEPNRPQRPNRPQFLEGRFGTCWAVLDRKSQNSSRWYQFGPSNFWIGYTKSQFGTSSQFGPSDSQIKIPIWPQQGLRGQTAFCRQKGRKETEVSCWSNHTSDTNQSTVRLDEQGTKITLT